MLAGKGNITSNAEYNFYADPEAANVVLHELGCRISLIPWELCLENSLPWVRNNRTCHQYSFLTRMLYRSINRFDDICWYFPLYSHIHCLVAVCQPFIKLLLTYLLTYLLVHSRGEKLIGPPHPTRRCDSLRLLATIIQGPDLQKILRFILRLS